MEEEGAAKELQFDNYLGNYTVAVLSTFYLLFSQF
jgi:hypothetical protein